MMQLLPLSKGVVERYSAVPAATAAAATTAAAVGRCSGGSAPFSTATTAEDRSGTGTGADSSGKGGEATPAKAAVDKEGIFSKHGGKMVLGFLGALGLWFLRNHLGNKSFDALKDEVEAACPLEPEEVEEFRCLNDYPPPTFRKVLDSARKAFPSGRATYPEFVRHVTASGTLPEPLFAGNLLDRLVLTAAAHRGFLGAAARGEPAPAPSLVASGVSRTGGLGNDVGLAERGGGWGGGPDDTASAVTAGGEEELDLDFLMVAFSTAVNTTPAERIGQLWELMRDDSFGQPEESTGGNLKDEKYKEEYIPAARAEKMVGLLLAGQQLPVGRYAVKDETRVWPVQQYRFASASDVFLKGLVDLHQEQEKRGKGWIERKLGKAYDPRSEEQISYELFERVLRSGSVCAWGECFAHARSNKL